ncbi:hypothetical protein ACHHYP_16787 [Achlya hypogyna]|uniref:Uncharacterized protein n=1 Tax=Achlya hypogyna TaxID=1202772 RepID=A0A1V9Y5U6_ACHHY|nr:hypothetical protein ACHHYP_16787 [Achlya hypogyna]
MASLRAARSTASRSSKSAWFSDPSTYPLIAILTFASGIATYQGVRHLSRSPDVLLDRTKRSDFMHREETAANDFRAHRIDVAHWKENPITRNEDFVEFRRRNTKQL